MEPALTPPTKLVKPETNFFCFISVMLVFIFWMSVPQMSLKVSGLLFFLQIISIISADLWVFLFFWSGIFSAVMLIFVFCFFLRVRWEFRRWKDGRVQRGWTEEDRGPRWEFLKSSRCSHNDLMVLEWHRNIKQNFLKYSFTFFKDFVAFRFLSFVYEEKTVH